MHAPSIYLVYLITCIPTGKIYVGRTTRPLYIRWEAHKSTRNARKHVHLRLYQDMRQYGIEQFTIQQIDIAKSFEDLKRKEREHILRLRSHLPEIGYNMSTDTSEGLELLDPASIERRCHSAHVALAGKRTAKHGVGVRLTGSHYYANISHKGVQYNVPAKSREEAMDVSDCLALHFHGAKAVLNYPNRLRTLAEIEAVFQLAVSIDAKSFSSDYHGVYRKGARFWAVLWRGKKALNIGSYLDEHEAAVAVDKARVHLRGPTASHFNFPECVKEYLSDPQALADWFEAQTIRRNRGVRYDARIDRYGVYVPLADGDLGLGYHEDPVYAARLRDMAVVYYDLREPLNYPADIETYRRNGALEVTRALADKVHGKRGPKGTSLD